MESGNHLNEPYPTTGAEQSVSTKERILLTAIRLFSQRGVAAVSVRDIAAQVNLRPASIYNHFDSKELLWEAVLDRTKTLYLHCFERLGKALADAGDWKEVLDCMFVEFFYVVDVSADYAFNMVQAEQFWNPQAYQLYKEFFFEYSIDFIAKTFDLCVTKGWVRAFDTRFYATSFMQNVLVGNVLRISRDGGREVPYDLDEMFRKLYDFLYRLKEME